MSREKRQVLGGEFKQLQKKLFIKTAVMMLSAILLIFSIYSIALEGHVSNVAVAIITIFTRDYDIALTFYQMMIRDNLRFIIPILCLLLFLLLMGVFLKVFTRYFKEINGAIDSIIDENSDQVELSQELAPVEKKINYIKNTLKQRTMASEIAEKRKNDLVVYLAHDLKTPLTSVIGYLTLLRDESKISDELREKYLSISLEKAERLEDLINEFFEITRFNLSNITLEYSEVNLTRMMEQLTFEFKPMLQEKNLSIDLDIQKEIFLSCDVDKMERVFDNLLRNAVNYSFEDSTIDIALIQEDDHLRISFANRGNRIPEEKLERIFEQFYRLDTARSSRSGGAGLGLAIAKEIVELHGGKIQARSEEDIITFEVKIPLS